MSEIDSVLSERQKTHGDFFEHARVTQKIKSVFYGKDLTDVEREGVEMIAHKLGRIAAGDPHFKDHWVDIAGYAQLVARECEK